MTNNPNRQPKGTTTGGQFATSRNPESEVDLSLPLGSDDEFDGCRASDLLRTIKSVPDDEPLIEYIATKGDADRIAERTLSDEEWRGVVREFHARSSSKYNAHESMMLAECGALEFLDDPDGAVQEVDNPYENRGLRSAKAVRELLAPLPADEPVIAWLRTRDDVAHDAQRVIPSTQWAKVVDNFINHDDNEEALLYMDETFLDVVENVGSTPV